MDRISFTVNGIKCYVGGEVSSDLTLVDYLRNHLELRGTKYMCREGGCGACIVNVVRPGEPPGAVNSCLVSITSCHNWEITTIEKVGNRKDGYHPIQKTLAQEHGTQCGYCSPGWVMAMYSLLKKDKNITQLEIEKSLGSNICRCTGYRSILDAFKQFTVDFPKPIKIADIEDLKVCKNTGENCDKQNCDENQWCYVTKDGFSNIIEIDLKDSKTWYKVSTVNDIYDILKKKGTGSYMLVHGNTAKGAYPITEYPSKLIDISDVSELKGWKMDQNLVVNANTTLTNGIEIFEKVGKEDNFHYLKEFVKHLSLIAHIPVRNLGSLAGNLMIKHEHQEFTSDIFLLAESVDAQLVLGNYKLGTKKTVTMQEFLKTDMRGKVILKILYPPLSDDEYKYTSFKIMPRSQNSHAVVNAGFLYRLKSDGKVRQSRIVYSGLVPPSTRADVTERYLKGKELFTNDTLQGAVKILERELEATANPPEPSPEYRKGLAVALFYKGLLTLCPKEKLHLRYLSGASTFFFTRPLSVGKQNYKTDPDKYPLTEPVEKLEALIQCSGEAEYTEDMPSLPREVFAAFVLTTEPTGHIVKIDAKEALSQPGVLKFYQAKDIPGVNSFIPIVPPMYPEAEEVLCSGVVKYYNQPLGIIVAESRTIAERAATMVKVTYKNVKRPVVDIKEAKEIKSRLTQYELTKATDKGNEVAKVIKGKNLIQHQYHLPMETLNCIANPTDQGLQVHMPTQWMDGTHVVLSRALKLDQNSIEIYVKRVGGSYGMKITRSIQVAVACGLVAKNLNRPCRIINSLTTNMRAVGKRVPALNEYEVGVDKSGEVQYADCKLYVDNGYKVNEALYLLGYDLYNNAYKKSRWTFTGYNVVTDTHKNTWCRSPGTLEAIVLAECMMEQISYETSMDPLEVRLSNLDTHKYKELTEMVKSLKKTSDYKERKTAVLKFNNENRWKKRGFRVTIMRWNPAGAYRLDANLSVYHEDGTVVITHSGIEVGQGINTITVQIASYCLNIPKEKIKVKGNNTIIGPNAFLTGGSVGCQYAGIAVQKCCKQLNERLKPIKDKMPLASWEDIIKKAYDSDIDLQAHGFVNNGDVQEYNVFGVCFAEVEVDILTGEHNIIRVDLLEDSGRGINPDIDVGQVEGAFVMGIGYWTSENIVFDSESGKLLTDRTWTYYVPQARDIPQDFRVYLTNKYPSSDVILGAKAIGEPPLCLSIVILFAIREAIASARLEAGLPMNKPFPLDAPCGLDKIFLAASTNTDDYKFN